MSNIGRSLLKFSILAAMLLGLPLLGVYLAGYPPKRYLQFPPQTLYVEHAPYSWTAFFILAALIAAVVIPLGTRAVRYYRAPTQAPKFMYKNRFPWWGWTGAAMGIIAWVLAWSRFTWLAAFQAHTFSPLWFSYVLVVNGLCWRTTGRSPLTTQPLFFGLLFPISAGFWWFFEYLNRFVQNWYYVGVEFGPWEYFWYATLPFSTVLPAVLSTREWLLSHSWIKGFADTHLPLKSRPASLPWSVLGVAAIGLTGIGVWPNYLFPLIWVLPFLIVISLQSLLKERHILSEMANGTWHRAVASALAALCCGWFWEMWNFFSFARWEYSIPLVQRYLIFEMPVLGYAGYLPFGLTCTAVADILYRLVGDQPSDFMAVKQ